MRAVRAVRVARAVLLVVLVIIHVGVVSAFRVSTHNYQLCSSLLRQSNRYSKSASQPTGSRSTYLESSAFGGIAEKLGSIVEFVSGQTKITEENIEDTLKEIRNVLIDADVNLQVTNSIIQKVKAQAIGMKVQAGEKPGEQFVNLLAKELVETMGKNQAPLSKRSDARPNTILMLGIQGAGKTTATAKLANWALKQQYAKKVMLVAADVYRPAAIEQLRTLGAKLDVEVYFEAPPTDGSVASPVTICRRAFTKAKAEGFDLVIFDTAGRQVVDDKLMDELRQIKAAVNPDESLLVVDAMTGQEAATLTATFNSEIGITGAILTKMDGDTKGGSALSVLGVSGKPIKFMGVGEGLEDLEPFYPERMASRILGMGDITSFIEKAQGALDGDQMLEQNKKMQTGGFDFNDYLLQAQSVRKMGGMAGMMKMMPGMSGKITDEQFYAAEQRMKAQEEIINAMTDEERANPDLIAQFGGSKQKLTEAADRRTSLAQRVGVDVREIDQFVMEFTSMRKQMKGRMKGMDFDAMEQGVDAGTAMMTTQQAERKAKKTKASRGGGGGFGAK